MFGEHVIVEAAPEPSNVIWENLEVTPFKRAARKSGVILLISLFIFMTFLLYTALKSRAGKNKLRYPSTTNCGSIQSLFLKEPGNIDSTDWVTFKKYAEHDKEPT